MPSRAEVHDVLVKARNLIDREGWHGREFSEPGGVCAGSAIERATDTPDPLARRCVYDAFIAVNALPPVPALHPDINGVGAIVLWNDAEGRTKEEVLAAFDKAIAKTAPPPEDIPLPDPLDVEVPA